MLFMINWEVNPTTRWRRSGHSQECRRPTMRRLNRPTGSRIKPLARCRQRTWRCHRRRVGEAVHGFLMMWTGGLSTLDITLVLDDAAARVVISQYAQAEADMATFFVMFSTDPDVDPSKCVVGLACVAQAVADGHQVQAFLHRMQFACCTPTTSTQRRSRSACLMDPPEPWSNS